MRYREEVINIKLAELLKEYGLRADPETIKKRALPDIMVLIEGIKVNLEGRFIGSSQTRNLKEKVKERIEEGIADVGIAIYYPEDLREAESLDEIKEKLRRTSLKASISYYSSSGLKVIDLEKIGVHRLTETIQNVFLMIAGNEIVREKVREVEEVMDRVTELASEKGLFFDSESLIEELKDILGIKGEENGKEKKKKGTGN